ncbi:MAG: hypothetical protein IPK67_14740 [Planctomycetes bacterium]|nr:hypothetical protein [Planctomycetota bacterium]
MRFFTVVSAIALAWVGVAERASAQAIRPQPHQPFSMVDTDDSLGLLPPPVYPAGSFSGPTFQYVSFSMTIGDGWPENVLVAEPLPAPTGPVPLLVVFHKFGSTQLDLSANTNFALEGCSRGWYVVCPLAANTQHYGSIPSQVHMEAVLQEMLVRYPLIDPSRIYAAGFSMGGGAMANYAARHVDPSKPMIAAMVSLSGAVALKDTYYSDPPTRLFLDFWYGNGTVGSADPFKLARSSILNFDPLTFQVDTNEDLARNLTHIPLQVTRATDERIWYLPKQNNVLVSHLATLGFTPGATYAFRFVPFGVDAHDHRWVMLDQSWACDWLSTFTLTLPTAARTLADRDDVYFHFFVEQDAPNAFTPFDWALDLPNNALSLAGTANLRRLSVDTLGAGLNPSQPLHVTLATADGLADEVVFRSVTAPPTSVSRDGNSTLSWSYNSSTLELTLTETDGLPHLWSVVP